MPLGDPPRCRCPQGCGHSPAMWVSTTSPAPSSASSSFTSPPQPAVGRVAHYVSRGSADGVYPPRCRAATITEVGEHGKVGLAVLNPTGLFFQPLADGGCDYHSGDRVEVGRTELCTGHVHEPGSWHWPSRS